MRCRKWKKAVGHAKEKPIYQANQKRNAEKDGNEKLKSVKEREKPSTNQKRDTVREDACTPKKQLMRQMRSQKSEKQNSEQSWMHSKHRREAKQRSNVSIEQKQLRTHTMHQVLETITLRSLANRPFQKLK